MSAAANVVSDATGTRTRCYSKYLEATANCGSYYTDDTEYEACMTRAWVNYIRCLNGLPPKPNN